MRSEHCKRPGRCRRRSSKPMIVEIDVPRRPGRAVGCAVSCSSEHRVPIIPLAFPLLLLLRCQAPLQYVGSLIARVSAKSSGRVESQQEWLILQTLYICVLINEHYIYKIVVSSSLTPIPGHTIARSIESTVVGLVKAQRSTTPSNSNRT